MALALAAASISACNKENDPGGNPIPLPQKFVKKLAASENDFQSFQFNALGNISSYTSQWQNSVEGGISTYTLQLTYDGGRLVRSTNQNGRIEYKYEGGRISGSENFLSNGRKLSTHNFNYNEAGRITDLVETIAEPDEVAATRIHYSYRNDGNPGRVDFQIKRVGSEVFVNSFSKVYEAYDDRPNPVPAAILEHFIPNQLLFRNNPKQIRNLDQDSNTIEILRLTYQYGNDGYPISHNSQREINGEIKPALTFQYVY